jgi:uncharacterized membrane protein
MPKMCQDHDVDSESVEAAGNSEPSDLGISSGRAFDRLVNFADAVVAIAITLLVLPLVGIPGPSGNETVWTVLNDNLGSIIAFLVAFYIVASLWVAHNRVMNQLRAYDGFVLWLNIGWLAGIAFMPWAAAMYGQADAWFAGGEGFGGVGLLFFGTLATLSVFTSVLSSHVEKHLYLVDPDNVSSWQRRLPIGRVRGWTFTAVFAVIGVSTLIVPQFAVYLPIAIAPVEFLLGRWQRRFDAKRLNTHDQP